MKEKNLSCKLVATVGEFDIYRFEAKKQDLFTGELSGQKKVYYDVCHGDDLVDSFKTLAQAKSFAKNYWN